MDKIKSAFLLFLTLLLFNKPSQAGVMCLAQKPKDENAKIELLIQSIEQLEGAQFYRNGEWYDSKTAAAHLRMKLSKAGSSIKTAQDFIDKIGTESSVSGEAYRIKYNNGKEVTTKEYFSGKLMEIEAR
jgi:hypothetical protein